MMSGISWRGIGAKSASLFLCISVVFALMLESGTRWPSGVDLVGVSA